MSIHSFDIEVAKNIWIVPAILYYNLTYWIEKNRANKKHFYNEKYRTYNSIKAFSELFPYITDKQIRTALKRLEDSNYIETGNFNKVNYDRTKWYCLKEQMELPHRANGIAPQGKPIPNVNTDNKPINNVTKVTEVKPLKTEVEIVEDKRNYEVQAIIDTITAHHWVIDGKQTENRQYAYLLSNKLKKINGFSEKFEGDVGKFTAWLIENTDQYRIWKTTSPKKIYYNVGELIANIRANSSPQKNNTKTRSYG